MESAPSETVRLTVTSGHHTALSRRIFQTTSRDDELKLFAELIRTMQENTYKVTRTDFSVLETGKGITTHAMQTYTANSLSHETGKKHNEHRRGQWIKKRGRPGDEHLDRSSPEISASRRALPGDSAAAAQLRKAYSHGRKG